MASSWHFVQLIPWSDLNQCGECLCCGLCVCVCVFSYIGIDWKEDASLPFQTVQLIRRSAVKHHKIYLCRIVCCPSCPLSAGRIHYVVFISWFSHYSIPVAVLLPSHEDFSPVSNVFRNLSAQIKHAAWEVRHSPRPRKAFLNSFCF